MTLRPRLTFAILVCLAFPVLLRAQSTTDATHQLARDIFKQLIEINTSDSVGSTTVAAEAMAKRLRDAGYPDPDLYIGGPNTRKGNLVARLTGSAARKTFS